MTYDPERHHRRSIRLRGYDYTQPGAYFVTLVTHERECLFGEIVDAGAICQVALNPWGEIAHAEWFQTAMVRPYVMLREDEFVVMPNHVHGIIWIVDDDCRGTAALRPYNYDTPPPVNVIPGSLGAIVRAYKSAVTKRINTMRGTPGVPVWQRNYYEHIIRNDRELERIRQYILDNPALWVEDWENPDLVTIDQRKR
jgi:REP element-mobilizing transposase RayT